MEERAKATLLQGAPWRRGVGWSLVAIEGVILVGVGIYILAQPDDARDIVRQLIAGVLLITSALEAIAGFRFPAHPSAPYRLFRSGIGITAGAIVVLEPLSDYLAAEAARWILGFGLLCYGLVGLTGTLIARDESGIRYGALITGSLTIALAMVFFTGSGEDSSRMNVIGVIVTVFGVLLLAYAYYLYRMRQRDDASVMSGESGAGLPEGRV